MKRTTKSYRTADGRTYETDLKGARQFGVVVFSALSPNGPAVVVTSTTEAGAHKAGEARLALYRKTDPTATFEVVEKV